MTSIDDVTDIAPRNQYTASAAQSSFDYSFPIFADADIVVDIDGVVQTLTTHYTVSGEGNDTGGTVTLVTPATGGEIVTIYRDTAITRTTDFQQNGPFSSTSFNDQLDKITLILQELENRIGRCVRFPLTATITNTQAEMSPLSNFTGKFLYVTSAGLLAGAAALDNVVSLTADVIGQLLYPQTSAESSAGVTPSNYSYPVGDIRRYGAVGDGDTDDWTAVSNAISVAESEASASNGRGVVKIPSGRYRLSAGLSLPTQVGLQGEGRLNSILDFALSSDGICVDLRGADTNNRSNAFLKDLRIDGTDCTGSSVVGVQSNWNQSTTPILDGVDIFGGYESGGAGTGLKYGLLFNNDGSNWILSCRDLHIAGVNDTGLLMNFSGGGSVNAVTFTGGRIEHSKNRNVVILGPNDDTNGVVVSFVDMTIEGASYGNTGVNSNVHIEGMVLAELRGCYLESFGSPNSVTYEVYCPSGRLNIHSCGFAFSPTCVYVGGTVCFSGHSTLRSSVAGIHIAAGGRCVGRGEIAFLGSGTPITFSDGTSVLDLARDRVATKTSNYTVTRGEYGTTFNNRGAKQNITYTFPIGPTGATFKFVNSGTSIRNSTYRWTASGSGTNEYYLELAAGGDPGFADPAKVYLYEVDATEGTAGSLTNGQWDYADNDSLGYSTIYIRTDAGDPDSQSVDTIMATYTVTIDPTTFRLMPIGTGPGDDITSDGALGSSVSLRADNNTHWLIESRTGTWT